MLLTLFNMRADDIIGDFYRKMQRSVIGSYVTDDTVGRLILKQKAHWEALFKSNLSRAYVESVRRIGIRHRDIALNPSWYVAGYAKLKIELMKRIAALDASSDKKISLMMTLEK